MEAHAQTIQRGVASFAELLPEEQYQEVWRSMDARMMLAAHLADGTVTEGEYCGFFSSLGVLWLWVARDPRGPADNIVEVEISSADITRVDLPSNPMFSYI